MEIEGYTHLWSVETGSGMWGTKRNDLDISSVYCVDTEKILRGERINQTFPQRKYRDEKQYGDIDVEEQSQEIGHLVNKLIDGNVNAIWVICSPLCTDMFYPEIFNDLQDITKNNLSKLSYYSIKGMVISQYNDHVKRAAVLPPGKAYRGAIRVANFGSNLLCENKIIFKGIPRDYIPEESEVIDAMEGLDIAYEMSKLPEKSNEDAFRDFLYEVRMGFMDGDLK